MENIHEHFTLLRCDYFNDCTLGVLLDHEAKPLCKTLEPPFRPPDERRIVGKTAVAEGTYPLTLVFDTSLHYQNMLIGSTHHRICFVSRDKATPRQTRGNVLIGLDRDDSQGCLLHCVEAFERVLAYYNALRCNHQDPHIEVRCADYRGRRTEDFGMAASSPVPTPLPDYMLYTC